MTTQQATGVPFPVYMQNVMQHLNELNLAYRNATADTWPEARDEILASQGMVGLDHLTYE